MKVTVEENEATVSIEMHDQTLQEIVGLVRAALLGQQFSETMIDKYVPDPDKP